MLLGSAYLDLGPETVAAEGVDVSNALSISDILVYRVVLGM